MYEPREDSLLLLKHISENIKPTYRVLDMGTGSGILALEAAKYNKQVIASDVDNEIIKKLKEKFKGRGIKFVHSDLFSNIKGKFDLIVFNPPYLPSKEITHREIDGGKNGTQIIEKFLAQAHGRLKKEGRILLLCSSLNKNIENLFKRYKYSYKRIDQTPLFFEKLFVYEFKKEQNFAWLFQ
ncbi:MAG: methyltransferase [Candidatus Pacearchaeota archaeon]|nr:methyltransferase [Candidatus Pacearchaeota archaeon]